MPQAYFTRSEERILLKKALATASAFSGGDGGNRNRVQNKSSKDHYSLVCCLISLKVRPTNESAFK